MNRAKRIWLALVFLLIFHSTAYSVGNLVRVAQSQLGCGEIGSNNHGKYVKLYNRGLEDAWCAGFVSYCLKESNINILGYNLRARDIWNKGCRLGLRVSIPQSGDIICFSRGNNPRLGHVGIVESVSKYTITTIEGNTGDFPSKVRRITYQRNHIHNLLGYIRVK